MAITLHVILMSKRNEWQNGETWMGEIKQAPSLGVSGKPLQAHKNLQAALFQI
jgi:hypothetical protein